VWFDAFVTNVDRTANNTNMLVWHRALRLIDHGAALYFHHSWDTYLERARDPFTRIKDHVLLPRASALKEADERLSQLVTLDAIREIVARIPDAWLTERTVFETPGQNRQAYVDYFQQRLTAPHAFIEEAIRARSLLV
jgi:hypothetical protein